MPDDEQQSQHCKHAATLYSLLTDPATGRVSPAQLQPDSADAAWAPAPPAPTAQIRPRAAQHPGLVHRAGALLLALSTRIPFDQSRRWCWHICIKVMCARAYLSLTLSESPHPAATPSLALPHSDPFHFLLPVSLSHSPRLLLLPLSAPLCFFSFLSAHAHGFHMIGTLRHIMDAQTSASPRSNRCSANAPHPDPSSATSLLQRTPTL